MILAEVLLGGIYEIIGQSRFVENCGFICVLSHDALIGCGLQQRLES